MALTKPQGDMLLKLAAEQASTSGTAITFSGIPAGTSMIVVMFDGVGLNSANNLIIRIGPVGGVETSGYAGGRLAVTATPAASMGGDAAQTGWAFSAGTAAGVAYGMAILVLQDATNNVWTAHGAVLVDDATDLVTMVTGRKAITGVLERVAVTSANPDTFDSGAISIAYF